MAHVRNALVSAAATAAVLALAGVGAAHAAAGNAPSAPKNVQAYTKKAAAARYAAAASARLYEYKAPRDENNTGPIVRSDGHLESAAVIRLAPSRLGGPYVHANRAHVNRGVRAVWVNRDNGHLEIEHFFAPVVTMNCPGDESIGAGRGIITGVSSGTGITQVRFFDTRIGRNLDLRSSSDYARVASTGSNLWCHWLQVDEDAEIEVMAFPKD